MNNPENTPETKKSARLERKATLLRQKRAMQVTWSAVALAGLTALVASGGGIGPKAKAAASARPSVCTDLTGGAKVACYASNFYSSTGLTSAQQSTLKIPFTAANAVQWSNLPVTLVSRNGLTFGSLTATQQTAFLNVVQAALSIYGNDIGSGDPGYYTYDSLRKADDVLEATAQNGSYGSGLYYMAFLGTPSNTAPWELQITGHHGTWNLVYNKGTVTATPNFVGVEPQEFTVSNTTYAPVKNRRDAIYAVESSLSSPQLATATLSQSFSDVLVGPFQDGNFPAQQGLLVSSMTSAQQALVKTAIEQWVDTLPASQAAPLLSAYESQSALADTYFAVSGATTPTAQGSYVRIDGPRV